MRDLAATTSTMSSREIAELTGKDHKHVLTDVRNMCESLKIQSAEFSADYKDDKGRTLPCKWIERVYQATPSFRLSTKTQQWIERVYQATSVIYLFNLHLFN